MKVILSHFSFHLVASNKTCGTINELMFDSRTPLFYFVRESIIFKSTFCKDKAYEELGESQGQVNTRQVYGVGAWSNLKPAPSYCILSMSFSHCILAKPASGSIRIYY